MDIPFHLLLKKNKKTQIISFFLPKYKHQIFQILSDSFQQETKVIEVVNNFSERRIRSLVNNKRNQNSSFETLSIFLQITP